MTLIAIIYIIGAILSFGYANATFYQIEIDFSHMLRIGDTRTEPVVIVATLFSWVGIMATAIVRFTDFDTEYKYWFKYKYTPELDSKRDSRENQ